MPPNVLILGFSLTVACNFHSVIKHGVAFRVVLNIKFDSVTLAGVLDSKEKPLGVAFRVYVILHETIVFLICYFLC
jgi:hypothetical protein